MPDKHFWDERYAVDEYVYGTEPNDFLVEHAARLIGPVLSLAEGEGRNAAFLASIGLEVHCVDSSEVGLAKARADFEPEEGRYGSVLSISAHLPSRIRARLYSRVERSLKPNGVILLEAYTEDQLKFGTGGPKDLDMLMTAGKIKREFVGFDFELLQELEREVNEGRFHHGRAAVVQFLGRKKG